ncbi:Succinate dehydrogenase iron-sulfur protein [hydrothermal vent metagenome]|uniref:succinate dehydrogenase n=1 Tax=hydrothermal vent metagenome TaxID=652676 RepID=A0A3B1E996_9ZZZZ
MLEISVCNKQYKIKQNIDNLLSVLWYIKENINNSLTFRSGCKSGVCGSCSVVVNGIETLSCQTVVQNNDIVEPLKNYNNIRGLVVDNSYQNALLIDTNSQLQLCNNDKVTSKDQSTIDKESSCILCNSCYSSCPVFSVNKNFIGPFALVRAYRYIEDKKESNKEIIINSIQENGVFDCTLCGNCNMVCPALIDIKGDILRLQNKSVQHGYSNPQMLGGFSPDWL